MARLRIFAASILFAVAIGCGAFSVYNYLVYVKADSINEDILSYINIPETGDLTADDLAVSTEETEKITYPALDIDYEALYGINPDFVGVLYLPVLEIYYPVAHSHDDAEYLKIMFDGTINSSGSIFLKESCNANLTSKNTVIYGHNMKNGTMFGSLKRFLGEEGLCAQEPYAYIYTKEGVYKYHIFAYYLADSLDTCWSDIEDKSAYDAYIEKTLARNDYDKNGDSYEDDFSKRPSLLTLSTCYGSGNKYYTIINASFMGIGNTPVMK